MRGGRWPWVQMIIDNDGVCRANGRRSRCCGRIGSLSCFAFCTYLHSPYRCTEEGSAERHKETCGGRKSGRGGGGQRIC